MIKICHNHCRIITSKEFTHSCSPSALVFPHDSPTTMGKKPSTSKFTSTVVQLGAISLVLSYTALWLADPGHHPKPAPTKKYTNFEDFYPFYL